MVTIAAAHKREKENGEKFMTLELQGDVELVQSSITGRFYATARRCFIFSTFDEATELEKSIFKFKVIVDTKGWIGDKLIGVDQNDIMKEMQVNSIDYHEYYLKYKDETVNNSFQKW